MHAGAFFNPHHPQLLTGLLVLAVVLLVMAAVAPELASLDLSLGGDGASSAAPSAGGLDATGSWAVDPLRPPVEVLAGR